jgi:flagellar hook-associated protein 1 FlgK
MTSLLNALNAGKTSLLTNQKSIEIVGNNIANVNTPGYSRQTAELTQIPALAFGDFFVGQGVTVSDINRDYSSFITNQLQDKSVELGEETGRSSPMTELERTFSVSEDNLAAKINSFFDAWQQLSANPSGQVERDSVIQQGQLLGDAFKGISDDMDNVVNNLNSEITAGVDDLNGKLTQIAQLNDRISQVEISGQTENAARDQRDLLVKDLAEKLGVQTYTDNRGMVNVLLPGGLPLVQGNQAMTIKTVTNGANVKLQLEVAGSTIDIANDNLGGEFKGMLDVRDNFIGGLRSNLDTLATDLTTTVNTAHMAGYDANGNTGIKFFNDLNALAPGEIPSRSVSVLITKASQVAAAGNPEAAPGDNQNALKIAGLENSKNVNGNTDTFDGFYSQMVSNVGIEAARNKLALSGAKDATTQLQNLRDGYSGVSLEEEMVNLMQYQRGFQSSAKFLATVDEMMNSLLQVKQ